MRLLAVVPVDVTSTSGAILLFIVVSSTLPLLFLLSLLGLSGVLLATSGGHFKNSILDESSESFRLDDAEEILWEGLAILDSLRLDEAEGMHLAGYARLEADLWGLVKENILCFLALSNTVGWGCWRWQEDRELLVGLNFSGCRDSKALALVYALEGQGYVAIIQQVGSCNTKNIRISCFNKFEN